MHRLNIDYDLLTWEGDILRLQVLGARLRDPEAAGHGLPPDRRPAEGLLGDDDRRRRAGRARATAEQGEPEASEDEDEDREKVIVRSNGTVTYVGKDIAYQFWKFGLLGLDFKYRRFATQADGAPLWATTSDATADVPGHPCLRRRGTTYNVIDVRQSYLQKLLKQALAAMGHAREAEHSIHFSYEMVALSHATARELGLRAAGRGRRRSRSSKSPDARASASRPTT